MKTLRYRAIQRDYAFCFNHISFEFYRYLMSSYLHNGTVARGNKAYYQYLIQRYCYNSTTTQQRCRCRLSGRAGFVITPVGLTRMSFRFSASLGLLRGVCNLGA